LSSQKQRRSAKWLSGVVLFIVELRGAAIKLSQLVAISLMDIVERLNI
jgi:hypothetical protein